MKRLELISGVDRLCEPGLNRSFSGLRRPFLMCLLFWVCIRKVKVNGAFCGV